MPSGALPDSVSVKEGNSPCPMTSSDGSNPAFSAFTRNSPAGKRASFIGACADNPPGSSHHIACMRCRARWIDLDVIVREIRSQSAARSGSPESHGSACFARSTAAMKSC